MFSVDNAIEIFRANILWALVVNAFIAAIAYAAGAVRGSGVVAGTIYGVIIYAFGGCSAFVILFSFFLMGSAASKAAVVWRRNVRVEGDEHGARGAGSVVGKCTPGALLAVLIGMTGGLAVQAGHGEPSWLTRWFALAYVGAFATALADTCASELGPLYGDTPVLLTTWESVPHGTPGGVSVAGTVLGLAGAILLGLLATMLGVVQERAILFLVVASFCASALESFLRARWPGQEFISKQMPNAVHTSFGALASVLLALALGY